MTGKARTIPIRQVYCPSCYLSTRADCARCLHCRRLLPVAGSGGTGDRHAEAAGGRARQNGQVQSEIVGGSMPFS